METGRMRNLSEVMRDEMVMRDAIVAILAKGPLTIPELAESMESPDWEVTVWVMAMRRYGRVKELPKARADDYYQYSLADTE